MKALVLAAGLGTRLRPYTHITPKPLFTVAGVTMLDRIIGQLENAGCSSIMVNTHHLHEKIEKHIKNKKDLYKADVRTVYEPVILDTGGAVKNLGDFWDDGPFFVVNSDIFTDADFYGLYRNHSASDAAATLMMHDDSRFNNVAVCNDLGINAFRVKNADNGRLMAFTGIQVVSPEILDFIPEKTPFSIIDAYRDILADGRRINAFVPEKIMWEDVGTPEAYLKVSKISLAKKVFGFFDVPEVQANPGFHRSQELPETPGGALESILSEKEAESKPESDIFFEKLKGDGSDRSWYRVFSNGTTRILAEHGIKNTELTCESESFYNIGMHLGRKGVPVPEIIKADTFSGHVFVDDLGNTHLADFVKSADDSAQIRDMYRKVISDLAFFSIKGIEGFDTSWTWQTPEYSREMVLEKECHYFRDAFLRNYRNLFFEDSELEPAFRLIAEGASSKGFMGLMHRDFQSKNIMIKQGKPYFIDYQGARKGPYQYDIASLLIDPYVSLDGDLVSELEDHAFRCICSLIDTGSIVNKDNSSGDRNMDRGVFMESLAFCRVSRNLQILGAFSFLSKVKGKKSFEDFIPAAVSSLKRNLSILSGFLDFSGKQALEAVSVISEK
jgi:aminoglycoside/choline kinase family phosphotransferase/dTDP-glucose pyrophosphorylase